MSTYRFAGAGNKKNVTGRCTGHGQLLVITIENEHPHGHFGTFRHKSCGSAFLPSQPSASTTTRLPRGTHVPKRRKSEKGVRSCHLGPSPLPSYVTVPPSHPRCRNYADIRLQNPACIPEAGYFERAWRTPAAPVLPPPPRVRQLHPSRPPTPNVPPGSLCLDPTGPVWRSSGSDPNPATLRPGYLPLRPPSPSRSLCLLLSRPLLPLTLVTPLYLSLVGGERSRTRARSRRDSGLPSTGSRTWSGTIQY